MKRAPGFQLSTTRAIHASCIIVTHRLVTMRPDARKRARRATTRRATLAVTSALIACASASVAIAASTQHHIGRHTHTPEAESARGSSGATLRAWEDRRSALRAMRHPENDLDARGACAETIRRACRHVEEARELVSEARRSMRYEESIEERLRKRRENAGGGKARALLYAPSRRHGGHEGKSGGTAPTTTTSEEEVEKKRAEEQKRREDEAKFQVLKSYPKGYLKKDPVKLEEDIAAVERQIKAEPENELYKRRLDKLKKDKASMISQASSLGFGSAETNHEDDHWFMDGKGGAKSYRANRASRRRKREVTARQQYEYIKQRVPEISKSYYDCIGNILARESRMSFNDFIEYGGLSTHRHDSMVSKDCVAEFKSSKSRVMQLWDYEEEVAEACQADIPKVCPKIESGYGLITKCVMDAREKEKSTAGPGSMSKTCVDMVDGMEAFEPVASRESIERRENAPSGKDIERKTGGAAGKNNLGAKREPETRTADVKVEAQAVPEQEKPTHAEPLSSKREEVARAELNERASLHSTSQSRNMFVFFCSVALFYGSTRPGARKRIISLARKIRRHRVAKGEHAV